MRDASDRAPNGPLVPPTTATATIPGAIHMYDDLRRVKALLLIAQREMAAAQSDFTLEKQAHQATTGEAEAARRDAATLRAQVTPKRLSKGQLPDDKADVLVWLSGKWREVVYRTGVRDLAGWDLWHSMPEDPTLDPMEELQLENARLKQQVAALLGGGV